MHGTPQITPNVQAMGISKITGGGSGDMAVLHSAKNAEAGNQIAFGKGPDRLNQNPHVNNMKTIKFKIRDFDT